MIIDVQTRIWDSNAALGKGAELLARRRNEPWQRLDASASSHELAMEPVNVALVHSHDSRHLDASIPLEQVAQHCAARPGRLLGVASIDPCRSRPDRTLENAALLGFVGVSVNPAAQGFHPTDSCAMHLYEACQAKAMPVFFDSLSLQSRDAKLEFAQPFLLDEVARTFPELKIVIPALGMPFPEQGLALIGKHPTVFAHLGDLALHPWRAYNALLLAYQHGVMGQLLFGSNFPFSTPEKAIVTVYSVNTFPQGTHLPSIPREQLRNIVERDALACLGLKRPRGAEATRPAPTAPAAATPQLASAGAPSGERSDAA
jgi:predicted TIM-barrel fold metal-dependent hydrolase